MTERTIFLAALDIDDPVERAAHVERACGGDAGLRGRVEGLLNAHEQPAGFMARPAPALVTIDHPATEGPGTVIGAYKLLEQIGEGGFGVVFMAEQTAPVRRKVALKILKPGMDTRQVVARFEAERQALALMDHPNIAKVLDGGATPSGRPYFVMELVRGAPITEFCDRDHLTPRQRLELFASVCRAVQHAHQKGVIHRDLKPTNVLVTVHDTAPVVKVIDFGVAKALGQELTDKTLFTGFAHMVGTPLYMSPEQAGQSGLDVDTRSDIYTLGVLLYELLTGTTPFDRDRFRTAGYDEIRRIIREEEPARPSTRVSTLGAAAATISASRGTDPRGLRRVFRGELDWVVMKCLEKDRNRRYETASVLAADVQHYLSDEPVQACPPSAWYRVRKFARRNRREVLAAGAGAVATVAAVVGLGVSRALIARALTAETEAKDELAGALGRERVEAYFHRISLAHRDLSADNLGRALKLLGDCPADLRGWEWHYLMRLARVEPPLVTDTTEVNGVAFHPDGERLATAGGDGAVKVWNGRTGRVAQAFPAHADSVVCVAFHPSGGHLATVGADRAVKVWDLAATGRPVFAAACDVKRRYGTAYTAAFSPGGRHLAAASDGVVTVWDWRAGQPLHTLPGHDFHSIPVAFSSGGRLATGAFRGGLKLWDPETGELLRTFSGYRHPVSALAFDGDGGRLASGGYDRTVKVWDTTTGQLLHTLSSHTGNVECVAFSPDGRRLASGGEDRAVCVWDAATGREVLDLRGHAGRCACVAFSPDGRRFASASTDGTVRVWDASPLRGNEGQEVMTFARHTDEIRSVAFGPPGTGGRVIASAGADRLVKVWDPTTGRETASFVGHAVIVFGLAWHPDGKRIATVGVDGRQPAVKVWEAGTARDVLALPAGGDYHAVAFSPDGRHLVTGSLSGAVRVWDAGSGREVGALGAHGVEVRAVAFSPDGRHLASASGDGKVKLWDATRLGQRQDARHTLAARVPGPGLNVAFSPDGRRVAAGGDENSVKIWDVTTGRELATLRGHTGEVYAVAFSPDGRWVASGGGDSTVKVWDSHAGTLARGFRGHGGIAGSVAFSPDGRRLASGSRDRTVKVWDLTPLDEGPAR